MIRFNDVTLVYPYVQKTIFEDLSFEVPEGEFVLVMGDTGSGKSTLLKIMSRITEPTTGEIVMNGRVASLLEVGTGFHPELTGDNRVHKFFVENICRQLASSQG